MRAIYLVCGVPGSGKTWVCKQLNNFTYVPHDEHKIADYHKALLLAARTSDKLILGEVPFRISVLIDELRKNRAIVKPYFIIEPALTVKSRYEAREKKRIPGQHLTRIPTIRIRARQYRAPSGTSEQILHLLKKIGEPINETEPVVQRVSGGFSENWE